MIDYPRAWQIADASRIKDHHPKCSYRTTNRAILCDCSVLYKHAEYLDEKFYGIDGKVIPICKETF